MIELDIKIRAKDQKTLKVLIDMMVAGIRRNENNKEQIDITFSAGIDDDTITIIRKEIIKTDTIENSEKPSFTPIEDFIAKSDLSIRSKNILDGTVGYGHEIKFNPNAKKEPPFKFAEDITKIQFRRCKNAGWKSWEEVEAELKRQKIKY